MFRLGKIAVLLLCISLKGASLSNSNETFVLSSETEINSIQDAQKSINWTPKKIPIFKISDKPHWVKVKLPENRKEDLILTIENCMLDTIIVFGLDFDNKNFNLGLSSPFATSRYSSFVQPHMIIPASNKSSTLYLKTQSNTLPSVPLSLFNKKEFTNYVSNNQIIAGFYFGILIVMLLYNLFVWASVKDYAYLYYCLYILSLIATQFVLQGHFKKVILPNSYGLNQNVVVLSGAILGITTLLFSFSFLKINKFLPSYKKGFIGFGALCIISMFVSLYGAHIAAFNLINLTIGVGSIGLLWAAIKVHRKGYKPAVFYIVAFFILLIGTAIYVMKDYGLLEYNNFTYYGYQVGSVIQIILLSLALANSINILKKEKEQEQTQKLDALEENKRIILNQNEILETKVTEKTKELVGTNNDLNKAMDDLKNTQVSLVESEKMASLGQLTAGVAHEINNPINFVSSNVKPLIRDFDDINKFISTILEKAKSGEPITSELVDNLHTELDIDYTQKEIKDLLVGIQEGADRTAEIVKGLKNFSRLDESDFKTADIEEGLDSTLILLRSNMRGEVDLVKNYAKIPPIDCYAGKLNQVFMNLINNSVYAILNNPNKEVGKKGTLSLSTLNQEKTVQIIIEDNGMGMDDETVNKLFNPFFTTKPVGEGTGLGMSITYSIINELHKGSIDVESEVGKGTKITLSLPKDLKK